MLLTPKKLLKRNLISTLSQGEEDLRLELVSTKKVDEV